MSSSAPSLARPALALLLGIALVDAALALAPGPGATLGSWWTSVGLGVALVAILPVRRWPAAVAAVLVVGLVVGLGTGVATGVATDLAVTTAITHAAASLVGALVLTGGGRRVPRLLAQHDLVAVALASAACGVVALAIPLLAEPGTPRAGRLAEVGVQYAVSTLLLCSLALLCHRMRVRRSSRVELGLQLLTLLVVTFVVLAPHHLLPLLFAPFPVLVWAALRFDTGVVAAEVVGFALTVTVATSHGTGPVARGDLDPYATGMVVLSYVLSVALVSLPLALSVRQRLELLRRVSADEHLFRRTFTESPLGMVLLRQEDGELLVEELNDAGCAILGTTSDQVLGRRLSDALETQRPTGHPDPALRALLDGADTWRGTATARARPGSRLDVAIASVDRRGRARIFSAQLLDVTLQHDAHRRLLAAHRLNDATLDTTACLILVADADGTVVRANGATREVTGYDDADLVGHRLWDLPLSPLSRPETESMFVWPNRSGLAMVTERLSRTAQGEPLRIIWKHNVVRDETGLPSYAVLTGIDVTAERSTSELMSHLLSAPIATALVGVDSRGQVTLANTGAARMLGWSVAELEGHPFVELFDAHQLRARTGGVGDHAAFLSLVGMIGDRDETPARDWTWHTRDGQELVVSMTLSVTEDLGEGELAFLCVARDVTEQREGQQAVVAALDKERTAVERLRALDQAKDEFVSTVSHELRTPVTSIIGYTEMLRDGAVVEPSPEQLPMLDIIARNSQRLVAICNDLLLLSGFESDGVAAVRTRVDLRECVTAARDSLGAAPEGLTINLDPGPTALQVTGDRQQLDRVVANLLGNAVKFTPAGGRVDVLLGVVGGRAVVTVRDTGIGIAADDQAAVFQRFFRTAQAETQAIPGTGLGLAIVAAIVEAHDGEITLESEPGRGTTIRVAIPLTDRLERLQAV